MYFLTAKSTKNSPADASAYFVPSNVRNGRLFAGLQANRPRFLPLLAGTSFLGFGIGPESFAAERGGKDAFGTSRKHRSLRSPLEAVLNRRIIVRSGKKEHSPARVPGAGGCKGLILLRPLNAGRRLFPRKATCGWFWYFCHQKYRESRDDVAGVLYLFSAKRYPKTPRQMPSPTSSRLTLAPGARLKGGFKRRWAAERIISDTTLSLLKPASYAGARAFSRAFVSRLRHRAGIVRRGTRREEVQNGPFRNLKPRFLTGRRTGRRAGRSCQSQCKSRFLTGRTREQG